MAGLLQHKQHILDVMQSHDKQAPELPNIPQLLHRNLSHIYDAIFHDEIPYGKNGITKNDQSLWKDPNLTIRHVDLKTWLCQYYPEEKPRFLFTKYEQFVHPAITIETAQALLIERNAIEIQLRQCRRQDQDLKLRHEASQRREDWIAEQLDRGIDVLLTNPELVKTGLDLLEFPTIVFAQTGFNVYTSQQAARRSWRIGQKQPVKVIYLGYAATSQMTCLSLMAKKIAVSQSTSGDVPESGLDVLNQDGDSVEVALARQLVK